MKDTEAIALPPLRPPDRRGGRGPLWLWVLILLLMLGVGFGAGWLFKRESDIDAGGSEPANPAGGEVAGTGAGGSGSGGESIADLLLAARLAMAEEDWAGAQLRYEKVLELESDNKEAQATLPRIADRIEALRGGLVVATQPPGAMVKFAGESATTTAQEPARFEAVSVGRHSLEISLAGYEPIVREVVIENGEIMDLEPVVLEKSAGSLMISSQPPGVNYVVRRLDETDQGVAPAGVAVPESEVVVRGTTPAALPEITVGRYEIRMVLDGWPDHAETVMVRNNRETSVSHVFASGGLQIISDPSGAEVWLLKADDKVQADPRSGELRGETPLSLTDIPSGRHRLALTYDDWAPIQRTVEVMADQELKLEFAWKRGLVNFISEPPGAEVYLRGERVGTLEDRTPFQWEFPEGDYPFHAVLPKTELEGVDLEWSVRADIDNEARFDFGYGSVSIRTEPAGATVLVGTQVVGTTPFVQPLVKPGRYDYTLRKENFAATEVSGEVEPGQELSFNVKLKYDPNPESGRDFTNSAGMKMRWVEGLRGWVGVNELHQRAYESVMAANPSYFKALDRPVDSVSWSDAAKFCEKLTSSELKQRKLPDGFIYRLPTDEEWSYFVGDADLGSAISSRGQTLTGSGKVGSSKPNNFGLYDVRGNVWEWCEDWYSTGILNRMGKAGLVGNPSLVATEHRFVRGGSWSRSRENELSVGWRLPLEPSTADQADVGFRAVLMPSR